MIEYFPEEIRQDILFRLPTKFLIRCTSVSKPWKSIIKNSSFIRAHLSSKINACDQHGSLLLLHACDLRRTRLLLFGGHRKTSRGEATVEVYCLYYDNHAFDEYCKIGSQIDCMVNPDPINGRFRVAGICDGLVCLADDILSKAMKYIIWNPSIRKVVMLPRPAVTCITHGPFEDSIGFGFDAMTNDYKVVRLVTLESLEDEDGESPTVAEIYSLATGSWRSLGSVAPPCRIYGIRRHTFFNGAIHWAVEHWKNAGAYYYFILAFDLGSESFREILMPKGTELHRIPRVSVSGDGKSLALFTRYNDENDGTCLDIWVMKEYCMHESWTKLITLRPQGPQGSLFPDALCFRKSGEVLLVLSEYGQRPTLGSLDLVSQQLNKLGNFEYEYFSTDSYEESLVLLDMDNAVSC